MNTESGIAHVGLERLRGVSVCNEKARSEQTRLNITNQQIPVKTRNPGRNRSKPQLSSTGFASFDRVCSSGELFDRDRCKLTRQHKSEPETDKRRRTQNMVVSRCGGIGPPSGIPPLGRCFCWPTNFVASQHPPTRPQFLLFCWCACPCAGFLLFPAPFPCRVSISQSTV